MEGVTLGLYRDLMPRSGSGDVESGYVLRADWVGMELLAPRDEVCATLHQSQALHASRGTAAHVIAETYGLPSRIANQYLNRIAPHRRPPMRAWWGVQ